LPEAADLLREAKQALLAARTLLEGGHYGDSVTRAYYAMLYAARALLSSKGVQPRTHGGVLRALGLHYVGKGLMSRDMVASLGRALEARQRADYGSLTAFTCDQAAVILEEAQRFVDHAGRFLRSDG
jgi:uncharacterized protein (UPF0332 family)